MYNHYNVMDSWNYSFRQWCNFMIPLLCAWFEYGELWSACLLLLQYDVTVPIIISRGIVATTRAPMMPPAIAPAVFAFGTESSVARQING